MKSSTGSAYDFRSRDNEATQQTSSEAAPNENQMDEPIGTTLSGYAPPTDGPFECANCIHYAKTNKTSGECNHPEVIADARAGEILEGANGAMVEAGGCCTFYRHYA